MSKKTHKSQSEQINTNNSKFRNVSHFLLSKLSLTSAKKAKSQVVTNTTVNSEDNIRMFSDQENENSSNEKLRKNSKTLENPKSSSSSKRNLFNILDVLTSKTYKFNTGYLSNKNKKKSSTENSLLNKVDPTQKSNDFDSKTVILRIFYFYFDINFNLLKCFFLLKLDDFLNGHNLEPIKANLVDNSMVKSKIQAASRRHNQRRVSSSNSNNTNMNLNQNNSATLSYSQIINYEAPQTKLEIIEENCKEKNEKIKIFVVIPKPGTHFFLIKLYTKIRNTSGTKNTKTRNLGFNFLNFQQKSIIIIR
jgi:hypothetical protein